MRKLFLLPAALLGLATPSTAQVTVDLRALDALPSTPSARAAPVRQPLAARAEPAAPRPAPVARTQPAARPVPQADAAVRASPAARAPTAAPAQVASAQPAAPVAPAPPPATIDAAPPPVAQLSAIAPPPPPAAAPPVAPPIEAKATTKAAETQNGLRVTFAAGQSDLSPSSADAIRHLVAAAPSGSTPTFNVVAYAAAVPDDASAARRLSLSRALAVRNALMADGMASSRIYVRALGSQVPEGPPDRVDLTLLGGNAQ
jgi:outer membrane protein OmpA-like peptidoglycan-associated protein